MKNPFVHTKKEEILENTEGTEDEETTPVEETEKKSVPRWAKIAAAVAGVTVGGLVLGKIFGGGSASSDWDFDEDGSESEGSEESTDSDSGAELASEETAE